MQINLFFGIISLYRLIKNEVKCTQNKENDMGNTCIVTFLRWYGAPPYFYQNKQ